MYEEKYENNTNVLIFKNILGHKINVKDYIEGTIIDSQLSDDLSYHGSPWYVIIYKVLGNDGNIYYGNMNNNYVGDYYFMTKEHYIKYLNNIIKNNENKIENIIKENEEYNSIIQNLKNKDIKIKTRTK